MNMLPVMLFNKTQVWRTLHISDFKNITLKWLDLKKQTKTKTFISAGRGHWEHALFFKAALNTEHTENKNNIYSVQIQK